MLSNQEIVAMAISAIQYETNIPMDNVRVVSFRQIKSNELQNYVSIYQQNYKKYTLGERDEVQD